MERETDLERHRKQREDLSRQLDQPFEHETKLTAASARQQEIVSALDLTKNQAAANAEVSQTQSETPEDQERSVRRQKTAMKVCV